MHGSGNTRAIFGITWLALAITASNPETAAAWPERPMSDKFGAAVALGDFNRDGRDELVVGEPGFTASSITAMGAIRVYPSLPGSFTSYTITLNTAGVPGAPTQGDEFGRALAVGDFDRDGFDDLAVGAPGRFTFNSEDTGAVFVLYGNSTGLQTISRVTTHGAPLYDGLWEAAEAPYGFGWSLAVGDFGGDYADDLAIGMPGRNVNDTFAAGAVFIRYGVIGTGTTSENGQIWHQGSAGVPGTPANRYAFGYALAAGDFGNSGLDDLAIGILGHEINGQPEAGAVMVMYGSPALNILSTANIQHIHQDWGSVHGSAEAGDAFGSALTAGRFDGDFYDDLVVGVPDENVDGYADAGFVNIMYGSNAGISPTRQSSLALNGPQADSLGENEYFGRVLTVGDFNDNGYDDLAVGAPGDNSRHGTVTVYYSSSSGVSGSNYQYWTTADGDELGGEALAAGDFDEDGLTDLVCSHIQVFNDPYVLGIEGRDPGGLTTSGGFKVAP